MSALPSFSTNDLRSASIDYKRDHEQKKWAHGVARGPGMGPEHHGRPAKPASRSGSPRRNNRKRSGSHAEKLAQRHEIMHESHANDSSSSSADEEVSSPLAAPTPNAAHTEVFFSYDSARSPSHGSQILNAALAAAIDKYESSATEAVVKREYDVLDSNGDVVPPSPTPVGGKRGRRAGGNRRVAVPRRAAHDEEEYEFV